MSALASFQPLLPDKRASEPLLERASELIAESIRLGAQAGESLAGALRARLRAMNSYYTNKIEGQHTRPADIERALRHKFDADKKLAKKQRIALAHIEAEQSLEERWASKNPRQLFAADHVGEIHRLLYSGLAEEDRFTDDGEPILPGAYRTTSVMAGNHVAPSPSEIATLVDGWASAYGKVVGNEALVVAIACSHHRLTWIHPFIDGNGRSARLHSHLALHAMHLTQGLWSPMRGLARTSEQYYARLNNADLTRRNDLDGRGALSQEELVGFAAYFLDVCLDQVRFMRERLDLAAFKSRLVALLFHLQEHPWRVGSENSTIRAEAVEALHYIAIAGPLERSRFVAMTGLGERTGRRVLASLLDYGVLSAASPRAPVALALPMKSLRLLFPSLWPEAETE